jgi:hypothetical protein
VKLVRNDTPDDIRFSIESCIATHGFAAEHSYDCFKYYTDPDQQRVFFSSSEGYGLMTYVKDKKGAWEVFGEPIAPRESRAEVLASFLGIVFSSPKTQEASFEISAETRTALLKVLPKGLRSRAIKETLLWPVLDMHTYDPLLPGSHSKPLRNTQNRFLREHSYSLVDAGTVEKKVLHNIVDAWKKDRPATHRAYDSEYHKMIDSNFAGTNGGKVLLVDGIPEGMSAGWAIPNSPSYYLALALHSYAYWGLGEILKYIKEQGFASVDLGGSDEPLLAFKKNFGELEVYKTHRFAIARV